MTAHITCGKVTFERRLNVGQYEHKLANIEFMVSAEDDSDVAFALELASCRAHDEVHRLLGIKAPPLELSGRQRVEQAMAKNALSEVHEVIVTNPSVEEPAQEKPKGKRPPKPPVAEEPAVVEATEITDVELQQAARAKQQETGNRAAVLTLIKQYADPANQTPFLAQTPQANRQALLDALKTVEKL